MAKVKINEEAFGLLRQELNEVSRENRDLVLENELVRRKNMMYDEALESIVTEQSYWTQESIQSGILFRLKNVLEQIRQMR